MNLFITGNDALAVDIIATKVMMLDWKKTYLKYIADRVASKATLLELLVTTNFRG